MLLFVTHMQKYYVHVSYKYTHLEALFPNPGSSDPRISGSSDPSMVSLHVGHGSIGLYPGNGCMSAKISFRITL